MFCLLWDSPNFINHPQVINHQYRWICKYIYIYNVYINLLRFILNYIYIVQLSICTFISYLFIYSFHLWILQTLLKCQRDRWQPGVTSPTGRRRRGLLDGVTNGPFSWVSPHHWPSLSPEETSGKPWKISRLQLLKIDETASWSKRWKKETILYWLYSRIMPYIVFKLTNKETLQCPILQILDFRLHPPWFVWFLGELSICGRDYTSPPNTGLKGKSTEKPSIWG